MCLDETGQTQCRSGDENRLPWLMEKQHNMVCRRPPNSVGCSISVALCSARGNQSETQTDGKAATAESFRHVPQIFGYLVTLRFLGTRDMRVDDWEQFDYQQVLQRPVSV